MQKWLLPLNNFKFIWLAFLDFFVFFFCCECYMLQQRSNEKKIGQIFEHKSWTRNDRYVIRITVTIFKIRVIVIFIIQAKLCVDCILESSRNEINMGVTCTQHCSCLSYPNAKPHLYVFFELYFYNYDIYLICCCFFFYIHPRTMF